MDGPGAPDFQIKLEHVEPGGRRSIHEIKIRPRINEAGFEDGALHRWSARNFETRHLTNPAPIQKHSGQTVPTEFPQSVRGRNHVQRPPGPSRHAFEAVFAPPPLPITSSPRDASRSASSPPNASVPSMRLRLPIRLHQRSLVELMRLRNVDSCKGRLPPRSRQPQCVCEQRRLEPQDFERGRPRR